MIERILRLGLTLLIVSIVAAVGLGLTYAVTKERIAKQKEAEEVKACIDALPEVKSPSELKEDKDLEKRMKKKVEGVMKVYTSKKGEVILVKARGYGGPINLAVGIGKDGKIQGVAVISHNETPGLGANLEKEEFLSQFKGKKNGDPLEIGKDVKPITGATVTTKAVLTDIKEALKAYSLFGR